MNFSLSQKRLIHIILSILLVLLIPLNNIAIKLIHIGYIMWLVYQKDAIYLPPLALLLTFVSNPYPAYFVMIFVSIQNYKKIKLLRIHYVLLVLLLFLPYISFLVIEKILFEGTKAGIALNQFQLYFALYAFFYGIVLSNTFSRKTMQLLLYVFFTLLILYFLNRYLYLTNFIRLIFYIIPFLTGYVFYRFLYPSKKNPVALLIVSILALISAMLLVEMTFTILLTMIFVIAIFALYYFKMNHFLLRLTGVPMLTLLFFMVSLAINGYSNNTYEKYKDIEMSDIRSTEDLRNRALMKFFEDRGPLWAGSWDQVKSNKEWLIPSDISKIEIAGIDLNFEYHAHNLYLEFIRKNGIIVGSSLGIVFIIFILAGRKILSLRNVDPKFIVFVAATLSTMIIGSFTGIYVLLATFASVGLSIAGVAYETYFDLTQDVRPLKNQKKNITNHLQ